MSLQTFLIRAVESLSKSPLSGRLLQVAGEIETVRGRLTETLIPRTASETSFSELLENMQLVAVFLDLNGRVTFCNEFLLKLTGLGEEDLLGSDWFERMIPDANPEVRELFLNGVRSGEVEPHFENPIIDANGQLRHILWNNSIIHGKNGSVSGTASIGEDITERRRVEKALQRNEQLLRLFVEHSPAAIAMFDLDMNYIVASRRFLLDYDLGDRNIIGRSHYELFPEIPERWREIHRRCLAGAIEKSEEDLFPRADGTTDWVRWEIRPWYEAQGEIGGIILFSEVVTEYKKAEEEIKRINEELQAINSIILTCATTLDLNELLNKLMAEALAITGLEGGTICFVTPEETLHIAAHRETSEATLEDLTTHVVKVGDCLCGQCARDRKPLILADREAVLKFSTREATRGEDIRFHAAFPLISGERCVGVLCVFTRTDLKPDERSLKLLETVSAQIGMAIDNAQLYAESVQQTALLEGKVKERTRELSAANERLKEVDRLKSMFIASMSHELRTPLNSVIGFSSILLNEWVGALNDEQKKSLTSILRSGKHLLSLINDVIDVSKIEAGMIEASSDSFDLAELLAELEQTFAKEAEDLRLSLRVQSLHHPMHADRRRLLQCLLNLVSNALKFTEPGGSVNVQVRRMADFIEISVTDNGIGIAPEDQSRLFQAFSRIQSHLTSKVLGTGLGLYLTKKIVKEILQGEISVTSELGKGSSFSLTIPVGVMGSSNLEELT